MLILKELKVVVTEDNEINDTYHVMQKGFDDLKLSKKDISILRSFLMKMGMGSSVLGEFDETV